ncbi:MAG: glycosyltransferase family 87 protein [Saprospiraceae bacterium]|nr:glycosyltransferase family 87 protein [Saprospiraceae bacterium]
MAPNKLKRVTRTPFAWLVSVLGVLIALSLIEDYLSYIQVIDNEFAFLNFILFTRDSTDSWWPMYEAAFNAFGERDVSLYEEIFFEDKIKFQYPPVSLLPFMVLIKLNIAFEDIVYLLNTVSFWSVFLIFICTHKIGIKIFSDIEGGNLSVSNKNRFFFLLLTFVGTYTFYPVIWAQHLGQVQVFIDLFVCIGLLAWMGGKKFLTGTLIALATLVKPQFGILIIWALFRREKGLAIGMLAILIPAGIVSLAVFGFREHIDYVRVLSYIGKHGEVFWANQSLNGLLNRMLSDVNSLEWEFHSFAPYNALVHVLTVISTMSFILLGLAFRPRWVKREDANVKKNLESLLDLSTVLIVVTVGSPIAWEHHYGIFWPILIISFVISVCLMRSLRSGLSVFVDIELFLFCRRRDICCAASQYTAILYVLWWCVVISDDFVAQITNWKHRNYSKERNKGA